MGEDRSLSVFEMGEIWAVVVDGGDREEDGGATKLTAA